MFTNYWYKALTSAITDTDITDGYTSFTGAKRKIVADNAINTIQLMGNPSSTKYGVPSLRKVQTIDGYGGVIFGTGTTQPTKDDTNISGELIVNISHSVVSLTHAVEGEDLVITAIYSLTNNGSEPFTVGEIALIGNSYGTTAGREYIGLLERTVLDTPITIEPLGVGQITYTIRIKF